MFWFQRRSVKKLSSTANADSAAAPNPDPDHLCSRRSNTDPAGAQDADSIAKTSKPDAAFHY